MKYTVTYQKNNKVISKILNLSSQAHLEEELSQLDNIIDLKEHRKKEKKAFFRNRKKEIFLFFKQLNLMLQSHLTFNEALSLILETNLDKEIQNMIIVLQNSIVKNYPVDLALKEYKELIGETPIVFLKQGLENGTIKNSIQSIVTLLEKELEVSSKLVEKLRYPIFLVLSLMISIAIIFIYVVPNFEFIFSSLEGDLPMSTQVLLLINKLVLNYWYIVLGFIVSLILFTFYMIKKYKYSYDKLLFKKLPIIDSMVSNYQLYKLFLSVYIVVESKYQFQVAVMNSINTITNFYLQRIIEEIEIGIKSGENIAELFSRYEIFDHVVIQLLHTAQNTGDYENILLDITNYYKESFDQKLKRFTSIIEPVIVSTIAFIVLWLILAVMVPIWQLSSIGL